MDDPWGSPWSSNTISKPDPTLSPPKKLLSPPPKAFFGSTLSLSSPSPWAEDAGRGDWTSEQPDSAANTLDWGAWADPSSQSSQPSPRLGVLGKGGSNAWPSSTATSPSLRPLPRSRTSSIFRSHSPDPWATELSLQDRRRDASATSATPSKSTGTSPRDESAEIPTPHVEKQNSIEGIGLGVDIIGSEGEAERTIDTGSSVWELSRPSTSPRESRDLDADSAPKVEVQDFHSRPSSTFSRDSYNGADRQDSPITSIDEDPRSRLRIASRKASGKVQELVGMYDGLAKSMLEELPTSSRPGSSRRDGQERSSSRARSVGAADDGDFGDFEDAKSVNEKLAPNSSSTLAFPDRSSTPKDLSRDAKPVRGSINQRSTTSGKASAPVRQLMEKFGPIRFDTDLQSIEKLFPDLPHNISDDTKEPHNIPEHIINDSFETISERKAWYRISRYGSVRKHDSGDEDNYHRVEWSTSYLHSETIKIVRRWMEEDSIAGRVTLGAGKRTSVFNWDSAAAPVDLGKVFARKASSATPPRASSKALPDPGSERPAHPVALRIETRKSIKSPIEPPPATGASFGWGSSAVKSPPLPGPTPSNNRGGKHVPSISQPVSLPAKTEAKPSVTSPTQQQPSQSELISDDDDDEWGEMVSSPRVESQPGPTFVAQSLSALNGIASAQASSTADSPGPSGKSTQIPSVTDLGDGRGPKQIPSRVGPSNIEAQRVALWPIEDFSVFENAAQMATSPKRNQDPWPLDGIPVLGSPTTTASAAQGAGVAKAKPTSGASQPREKSARADTGKTADATPPLTAVLGPIQKDQQRDQDEIVQRVVKNLPDLSYMLR
ncbi:hypothetical protein GGS23DRAFT_77051 [Durotheca rogersii]|uniref:uncharacterized protein n=1 Tax=Durotheca rogersii TaxID=419775 RepID=UPI00221FB257|nr:uncharacterized protein GGS23DRAFT_77051 [Durotheca rogersii]KAI5862963.1 hypothetical protein GGS23DRAFT_77051 [Durotheca rogersii]